jgi:hypothetical protein
MNKKPGLEPGFSLLDEWLAGDRTDVHVAGCGPSLSSSAYQ